MKTRSILLFAAIVLAGLFGVTSAQVSNISIGANVPMQNTNEVFTCSPNQNLVGAFYDGQVRRNATSVFGQDNYEFHYYNTTNIRVYNPYNSLRTSPSNATVPSFQFRSQVLPITRPSGQGIYLTIQDNFTYLQANNPRNQLAGQFVHYINRGWTQTFAGSNRSFAYRVSNGQFLNSPQISYNSRANNITPFSAPLTMCHNFYIARCGDGVIDNPNKPGGPNTDGKQGIQTADGFIDRVDTGFTPEVCDDGPLNGQPGYCNTTCSGFVPLPEPVCESIQVNPNPIFPNQSTNIVCNATNATSYSINVTGPGSPFNYTLGNSTNFTPTIPGEYTVSCTAFGPQGTTPSTCPAQVLTVTDNSPQCEAFTATPEIVGVGESVTLFCDGNQFSNTYQILVQDQSNNLVASFNGGLPAPGNNVTTTWTPNAPGTYTTNCSVSNNNTQVAQCPGQTVVVGQADLQINKVANQTSVAQGDNITFTIRFSNRGSVVANNVTIEDILPVELTYVSHSLQGIAGGTSFSGQTPFGFAAGFSGLTLQPGQSATMTIIATYTAQACNQGVINFATVYNNNTQNNDTATFDCIPPEPARIVLDKKQHVTGNPTKERITVESGDVITYTITVTNEGELPKNDIYLKDSLPPNTTYISSSISGLPNLTSTHAGGIVSSSQFSLAPGEVVTWLITASIDTGSGLFINTGSVFDITNDKDPIAEDGVIAQGIGPALTLSKVIANQQDHYLPGDAITYIIRFANIGDAAARDVVIQDILPPSVTYVSSSISPNIGTFLQTTTGGSQVISYGGFTLNPGQTITLTVNGIVNTNIADGTKNFAILQSSNHPPLTATANFVSKPVPQITKEQRTTGAFTSNQITVNIGDTIEYKVTVRNVGGSIATGVVIRDTLPLGVDYIDSSLDVAFSNTNNTLVNGQTVVSYEGITLAPGQSATLMLRAQVTSSAITNYRNRARVTFQNPLQHKEAEVIAIRVPTASVQFTKTKTTNKTIYEPGDTVSFALNFVNNGPATVTNISLQDIWPRCLDFAGWTSNPQLTQTNNTSPYSRSFPSLGAGQSILLNINGTVINDPSCTGTHVNTGVVTYTIGNNPFIRTGTVAFEIRIPEDAQCLNLTSNVSNILFQPGQQTRTAQFTCTADKEANIQIDCGNGTQSPVSFGSSLTHSCRYTASQVGQTFTAQCIVDGQTDIPNTCQRPISITQGSFGICGDGVVQGYEQCDITNPAFAAGRDANGRFIIGDWLDNGITPAPAQFRGSYCENCAIKGGTTAYEPPACFYTNTTISVQRGETLPFWRDLDKSVNTNITAGNTCTQPNSIPVGTMMCTFSFYAPNELNPGSHLDQFTVPCFGDTWGNEIYFNFFRQAFPDSNQALGKYYWQVPNMLDRFGEHKVRLDRVEYEYCNENLQFIPNPQIVDRVCEVNFAVTRPYLVQKSVFSNIPKTTTIDIGDFYAMDGRTMKELTDLSEIMVLNASTYAINPNTNILLHDFVSKYKQLAVTIPSSEIESLFSSAGQVKVSKVPGQQIYIFESQGASRITLREMQGFNAPFTMIIDGMDLVVQGSITNTNGMFLVKGGKISFQEPNNACASRQVVNGVFITDEGFGIDDPEFLINNRFGRAWCNEGGLTVRGVLIGRDINRLVAQRRSHLNTWFQIANPNNLAALRAERRNKIFDGAALLIEYNPALRNSMPPGMNEFTQVLDVYRQ